MRRGCLAWAGAMAIWLALGALPAAAAEPSELYVKGDIGVSFGTGDATGRNDGLSRSDSGEDEDASPVYGVALGVRFALNRALPWRWRTPEMRLPYWPGRHIECGGGESGFPEWPVSFELEYLRGRNYDYDTRSFTARDPYRAEVDSWTTTGNLRLDVPVRSAVQQLFGRVPFLDPLSVYLAAGAGVARNELEASQALSRGTDESYELAWHGGVGLGYQLSERVRWSAGWRYVDLGSVDATLKDNGSPANRTGSYSADLRTHEFTTSLTFAFWRVSFLGDDY